MDPDMVLMECEENMEKALEYLHSELRGVRTGRASISLIEFVKVDCYGSMTDLKNLASLSTPEPTQIVIKAFDPSTISAIIKGIERASLGLNPQSDGKIIRVPVPALSGERRTQLANQVKQMGENAKVSVRNCRREANKQIDHIEKDKTQGMSEDMAKSLKEEVHELIKKNEAKIDDQVTAKINEIMDD